MFGTYGRLSEHQKIALRPFVQGKIVHDLGAGSCSLSVELIRLGAASVIAVDKEPIHGAESLEKLRVFAFQAYFSDLRDEKPEVAFLSWPANRFDQHLLELVEASETVVYLGSNTDGSACGWPGLFREFLRRERLAYAPERKNTLIVYGKHLPVSRTPRGEEYAGLTSWDEGGILRFDEIERS